MVLLDTKIFSLKHIVMYQSLLAAKKLGFMNAMLLCVVTIIVCFASK